MPLVLSFRLRPRYFRDQIGRQELLRTDKPLGGLSSVVMWKIKEKDKPYQLCWLRSRLQTCRAACRCLKLAADMNLICSCYLFSIKILRRQQNEAQYNGLQCVLVAFCFVFTVIFPLDIVKFTSGYTDKKVDN